MYSLHFHTFVNHKIFIFIGRLVCWCPDQARINGWIARLGELCPHGHHGPADELVLRAGDHVDDGGQLEQVEQVVCVAGSKSE